MIIEKMTLFENLRSRVRHLVVDRILAHSIV
uniref:Uncharacterized protein n=1 Tax=Anguilla anguilla TaxID=7936 RepID=A0A0E9PSE5_ANGAN